jgi:phosphoenolpyruvate phosphomutase
MSDYLEVSRQMSAATSLPVLADCDSGFGGAMNVAYLVLEYEAAGVAGVCIEDKAFPKMNSFVGGGQVLVPTEDFTTKIDSAVRARKDPDFVIVARTESYIAGCDTDEAIRRCEQYADAGADAILVHSRQSTPAEVFDFMAHWHRSVPVIAVPTTYHSLNLGQAQEAGLSLVIYANQGMRASIEAVLCTLRQIRSDGSAANVDDEIASLAEVFDLQGLDRWLALTDDSR